MKTITTILILLFLTTHSSAENIIYIKNIKVTGAQKTDHKVILNELNLAKNSNTSIESIKKGITELKNTNLFSTVEYQISGDEEKDLIIKVEEKWTTIPIFKFSSGGGVGQLTLGVYDPNVLGHFLEAGFQYERLEDTNSGVVWFKNPRLFGKKQGFDIQLWSINRLRTKYQQEFDKPDIKTGFLHKRQKLFLNYYKELNSFIDVNVFYEYNDDQFSIDLLETDVKQKAVAFGLPIDTKFHFVGLSLDFGQLNYDSFRVDGLLSQLKFRHAISSTSSIDNFSELDLSIVYAKTLWSDITFAQRFLSGLTNTEVLQYWKYLGGLDSVRGFADNRFAGKFYWLSNTEIRVPIYHNKWFVLQGVGFTDLIGASESFKTISNLEGASIGAGLRVYLPKVYRFVVRFDYAQPIKKDDDNKFSFGVQQFF